MIRFPLHRLAGTLLLLLILASCRSSEPLISNDFSRSSVSAEAITDRIPNYHSELAGIAGKGRAIVSEPNNTERITIEFASDRDASLMLIRNRIGIEAGSMLVKNDSVLIYNKIDGYARIQSVRDPSLTGVGELASMNLIRLLNYTVDAGEVQRVMESETHYLLHLRSDGSILVSKEGHLVSEVNMPGRAGLPYSRIIYESYGTIDSYTLPRKITIFSSNGVSKVLFQVRDLTLNPDQLSTELKIPDDITTERL